MVEGSSPTNWATSLTVTVSWPANSWSMASQPMSLATSTARPREGIGIAADGGLTITRRSAKNVWSRRSSAPRRSASPVGSFFACVTHIVYAPRQ